MQHQVEIKDNNTKFVATLIRIGASALPFFPSQSLFAIHSRRKEMQNKNKNNRKVTKLPTAKLIEIAVANCKSGHNLEILLCPKSSPVFPD